MIVIGLSQDAYIDKILNRFIMQDSKKGLFQWCMASLLARNSVLHNLMSKRE
jgi:hypothetical protein